jgi:hypothetical protein
MTAIDIDLNIDKVKTICVINLYNPPKKFEGLAKLQSWLLLSNNRRIPTFLVMDSNLHHKLWNPPRYPHSHCEAKDLIKTCGQMGFKIISQKGVPTFANRRNSKTTIDLTWANAAALKFVSSCVTTSANHGSDHQAISLVLNFNADIQINERLTCNLEKINFEKFQSDLKLNIATISTANLSTANDIDLLVERITIAIQNSIDKQKRTINHNIGKIKPWWDSKILDPIVKKRNRAQKWMMLSKSPASFDCYQYWQKSFKETILELTKGHWRKFLAECDNKDLFKAYRYTKPSNNNSVAPLLDEKNVLTSNKE